MVSKYYMPSAESVRLDKLLSNLGYCSRREVAELIRLGVIEVAGETKITPDLKVNHAAVRVDGEALDPTEGLVIMMHKPRGYECSHAAGDESVFALLPPRFAQRKPTLACVGRLDKDTTGLLLFSDDGDFVHRLTSPKHNVGKVYRVDLGRDLRGDEAAVFASGTLLLADETEPLKAAELSVINPRQVLLTLYEGRFHQVKRMFGAVENHVAALHRESVGALGLGDLPEGEWRYLTEADRAACFG